MTRTQLAGVALGFLLACVAAQSTFTQENPAIDRAKRVLDLLQREQFDDVARDFNAKVSALLSTAQLRDVWSALGQQAGPFTSILDARATTPVPGVTAVVLGCQFEKTALNVIVAFDADGKIGGLRFAPRASAPAEPSTPPASSRGRFSEEAVTVGTGEWALPGTLSLPVGPIAGAVVLVHGSGPSDRDETIGPNKPFRDLAWGLADRGVAVLRYEKRTRQHGGTLAGIKNLTVREEAIDDALLAAALLRTRERIDPKRVFVLGHSLGGTLAPRIAADDRSVAGLIIMAGSTRPLLDVAREQLAYLASITPGGMDPEQGLEMLRKSAPESYWKDLDSYDPARVAAKLTIPMLILQGERDYQVTLEDLQGWRRTLGGLPGVTIKSYPTLNHLFMPGEGKSTPAEYERAGRIPELVLDDIAQWIMRN
ncbi:MAG TPA: alpha/beta fold hydrolase [Vicinamibacterales bacterium]|jgi:dienelactone hydrolase